MATEKLLTPQEVMSQLGVSRAHLFRLLKQKKLTALHPGVRILRFRQRDVDTFLTTVCVKAR